MSNKSLITSLPGQIVRLKRHKPSSDLSFDDRLGKETFTQKCNSSFVAYVGPIIPLAVLCQMNAIRVAKRTIPKCVPKAAALATDQPPKGKSRKAKDIDDLVYDLPAKLLAKHDDVCDEIHENLVFDDDGLAVARFPQTLASLMPSGGIDGATLNTFLMTRATKISYQTVSAFAEYPWTPELEEQLKGFQRQNPHDILPLGILKVGPLNYWWKPSRQDTVAGFLSLAVYLLHFPVLLGRAVTIGTLFPNEAGEYAKKAYGGDATSLSDSCNLQHFIRNDSIDSELCMKILNANPPTRLCYLLTTDLEGVKDIGLNPNCDLIKQYIKMSDGSETPRKEAIQHTVGFIGNLECIGVGELVQKKR
ncbi:hypothetical protein PG996_006091 [Apiospora saccharicola]|uniref:Uncharacterized protein n=1 Tax=Apiospora saccharicola TaxID=335842 RepID=A0ABR1VNG7_9PEZI